MPTLQRGVKRAGPLEVAELWFLRTLCDHSAQAGENEAFLRSPRILDQADRGPISAWIWYQPSVAEKSKLSDVRMMIGERGKPNLKPVQRIEAELWREA